ncbi:TetR/AcrR family transcriptional regulator [Curtobacterium aurantiacum]|uniref:TetR/AcrR family transcriptional regulator n=1 Tax=Curtobacterium aurantiacum TaxID=3236919 RepID=A0ABS5VH86_9MICO|nr:TetR/AcrR family transcriptional regulator [Curtobacterium flaccumfaciens]MBT1546013.1 TetR/AcrR family transcriptional regulator [Curtobacterium flaccumfaciens pv. flaccumfaciens]MBT1588195.1 TetR/AcrR family transcriptional regulator [Curtobacterium flaccumfaciens pv. flaccumfaciens]MBT1679771.1 TetR/AcrR family transcriptional regulator [Curtobacterium flaccumfaciens pv. flaccumfaciens]
MTLMAMLEDRRPRRLDARRNFDAVLAAATEAFGEAGADVGMEEIARRAGVGVATLYRNFPTRVALMEAVYLASVVELVSFGSGSDDVDSWTALRRWLEKFVDFMRTKHPVVSVLTEQSEVYDPTRDAIYGIAEPLFDRAREDGQIRGGIDADDVMRVIFAVTGGLYRDAAQRVRALQIVLDGIRSPLPARDLTG